MDLSARSGCHMRDRLRDSSSHRGYYIGRSVSVHRRDADNTMVRAERRRRRRMQVLWQLRLASFSSSLCFGGRLCSLAWRGRNETPRGLSAAPHLVLWLILARKTGVRFRPPHPFEWDYFRDPSTSTASFVLAVQYVRPRGSLFIYSKQTPDPSHPTDSHMPRPFPSPNPWLPPFRRRHVPGDQFFAQSSEHPRQNWQS